MRLSTLDYPGFIVPGAVVFDITGDGGGMLLPHQHSGTEAEFLRVILVGMNQSN